MGSALTAAHYEVALMAPTNTKVGLRLEPEIPEFFISIHALDRFELRKWRDVRRRGRDISHYA